MVKKLITISVMLTVTLALFGCNPKVTDKPNKGDITVATMIDSEGAVLGSMMVTLLREDGFNVIDKTEFGTPEILRQALVSGEVDLVLDYTGSGQYYHEGNNADEWSDADKGYLLTKKLDKEVNNIIWLTPANANNTEGLAVKKEFAETNKIATMVDFAKYVNGGGKTKLICSSAFAENIKGLRGLEQAYGFKLSSDQLVILASGNTAEMLKALTESKDGINVSLVYGTDGALDEMNLFVIADPKSIPPVYLPTPVLRGELYQKHPEIETLLKPLFSGLTIEILRELNSKVVYDGMDAKKVAADYLEKTNLLKK